MKRAMICLPVFLACMSASAFAQDMDDIIGKMKGVKRLTAGVRVLGEDGKWSDPILEIVGEWNDKGDLTLQSALGTDTYSYTYDEKDRKTTVVKKDGRGVLQSKSRYVYAADGSFEIFEEQYMGDKPGQEKSTRKITSRHNPQGKILSRRSQDDLVGVVFDKYTYDEKGYLTTVKTEYDGGGEMKTRVNDARGNPLEVVVKDFDGKVTSREVHEWDDRNYEKLRMDYSGNGALIRKMTMTQQYNERDLPKEMLLSVYDEDAPEKVKLKAQVTIEYLYYPKR